MALVGPRRFVTLKSITISKAFQLKVSKKATDQLGVAVETSAQRSSEMVSAQQKNVIAAVRARLIGGITPLTGGTKAIKYNFLGKPRRLITPKPWPELSQGYASKAPVSTTFWAKHHGVASYAVGGKRKNSEIRTRRTLASLFAAAEIVPVIARATSITTKSSTKEYFTFTWDVSFPVPRSVLGELISEPFAEGVVGNEYEMDWWYNGPISTADASFIVYVEGHRPFIRRLAWKSGKELRLEIGRALRAGQKKG